MASLYELSAGYAMMIDAYDNAETDEEREQILAMLAETDSDIENKAENYAKLICIKQEEAKAFKAEIDRLTQHKRADENMVERLKAVLLDAMKLSRKNVIQTKIGKWRLQMNPVSCEVEDIEKVPEQYRIKQEDKADKKALIDHYKQTGELIEGVKFTQEPGIRFR